MKRTNIQFQHEVIQNTEYYLKLEQHKTTKKKEIARHSNYSGRYVFRSINIESNNLEDHLRSREK